MGTNQDSFLIYWGGPLRFGYNLHINRGQPVFLAPGIGKTNLLSESMFAQLGLYALRILVSGCKLQSFFELLLLLFDKYGIGIADIIVNFLIILKLGKIENGMSKLIVLEVGQFRFSRSPFFKSLLQCSQLFLRNSNKIFTKKIFLGIARATRHRFHNTHFIVESQQQDDLTGEFKSAIVYLQNEQSTDCLDMQGSNNLCKEQFGIKYLLIFELFISNTLYATISSYDQTFLFSHLSGKPLYVLS